ncbi:fruit bromelain-like [Ananas comosus]|uniref:Fruit bromelain-like n=1 Tax=Ananas comosus TaxID=4615 RepID=A0A6P5F366_ANACO|nr:fruit bromelain-like [Ananas comosus]
MGSKFQLVLFYMVVSVMLASPRAASRSLPDDPMMRRFEEWMARFHRVYTDDAEKWRRFQIFQDNVNYIESFNNRSGNSYTLGTNQFADMTFDEFLAKYTGTSVPLKMKSETLTLTSFEDVNISAVPKSIDWRDHGAVTEVKQQGTCESCWAFTAIATVEGIYKIKKGSLIPLSEQEVLDCSVSYGCKGGGWVHKGYDFIISNKGVATEASYPYKEVQGNCASNIVPNAASITGYKFLPRSESKLMNAVSQQPVAAAVEADKKFQLYTGGIYKGPCGVMINHAITVIGYGADNSTGDKYWIIKNSWGTNWGENGFMRLEKDVASKSGLCGLTKQLVYPTITSTAPTELAGAVVGSDSLRSSA